MAQLTLSNRILTLTDNSGTSSVDLSTIKGDDGPRGPQGPAGIVVGGNSTQDMSNYYTKSEVNTLIENVDANVNLTGYATENYVNQQVANISIPTVPTKVSAFVNDAGYLKESTILRDYYTKTQTDAITSGLASESFVTAKIAEAQLGGGSSGGSVDLSGFATKGEIPTRTSQLTNDSGFVTGLDLSGLATKSELDSYRRTDNNTFINVVEVTNGSQTFHIYPNGISGDNGLWIDSNGEAFFASLYVVSNGVNKPMATQEYVDNAIAALDGSEVPY